MKASTLLSLIFVSILVTSVITTCYFMLSHSSSNTNGGVVSQQVPPSLNVTRPVLRRHMTSYTVSEDDRRSDGGTWSSSSKKPVCSKNEFLLNLTNLDESKQVNVFYSKEGGNDDRLALASGSAKSEISQCCPHYGGVGVNLYYKFHNEPAWFKYPHKIDKQFLSESNNTVNCLTGDFIASES